MKKIALLTEKRYLKKKSKDWYVNNIWEEDHLIIRELEGLNIGCERVAWDGSVDLSEFHFALFRTTWNYFDKLNEFLAFLKKWENIVQFINPYEQIIWNLNKKYLLELEGKGINIVKTKIICKKNYKTLVELCEENGWESVVIKPCVSAAAWQTYYIKKTELLNFENLFFQLVQKQEMIIQPFQHHIVSRGELSIIMIGGKFSHAVIKRAKKGDFRVQDDFGGSVATYQPSKKEIDFSKKIIKKLSFLPTYARVDVVLDNSELLALSELELIEPEIWFRLEKVAAKKLAQEIKKIYFSY